MVVDSVAALVSKVELEGQMGDTMVGLQARMMTSAMRRLTGAISKTNCVCIFTNQIREKIGVMFGSPETTPVDELSNSLRLFEWIFVESARLKRTPVRLLVIARASKW